MAFDVDVAVVYKRRRLGEKRALLRGGEVVSARSELDGRGSNPPARSSSPFFRGPRHPPLGILGGCPPCSPGGASRAAPRGAHRGAPRPARGRFARLLSCGRASRLPRRGSPPSALPAEGPSAACPSPAEAAWRSPRASSTGSLAHLRKSSPRCCPSTRTPRTPDAAWRSPRATSTGSLAHLRKSSPRCCPSTHTRTPWPIADRSQPPQWHGA